MHSLEWYFLVWNLTFPYCLPPQALVEFFQRVIHHQAENKMTLNNVSVIMAPNIFMFKGFRSKITEQQEYSMAAGTANIVRLLIRYQNLLWTVNDFLASASINHENNLHERSTWLHSGFLKFSCSVCRSPNSLWIRSGSKIWKISANQTEKGLWGNCSRWLPLTNHMRRPSQR